MSPKMGKVLVEEFTRPYAIKSLRDTIKNQTFNTDIKKICDGALDFLDETLKDSEKENDELEKRLLWTVKNLGPKNLEKYALKRKWK